MKKIFIPIIALLGFSSCQDCKDCTVNTDVTVLIESISGTAADSTITYSQAGIYDPSNGFTNTPENIPYYEYCGTELKDVDGKTETLTEIDTNLIPGLRYTFTWTEKWDCK